MWQVHTYGPVAILPRGHVSIFAHGPGTPIRRQASPSPRNHTVHTVHAVQTCFSAMYLCINTGIILSIQNYFQNYHTAFIYFYLLFMYFSYSYHCSNYFLQSMSDKYALVPRAYKRYMNVDSVVHSSNFLWRGNTLQFCQWMYSKTPTYFPYLHVE